MAGSAVNPTPLSLLNQLRDSKSTPTNDAWRRFVQLYTPLLLLCTRRLGVGSNDAADLVQEVFTILAREMPAFEHDPKQRFRAWLWTILINRWRDVVRHRAGPARQTAP